MIIDHIGLEVTDYQKSKDFYIKALSPLGIELIMEIEGFSGFGVNGKPEFWISQGMPYKKLHIAFKSKNRDVVNQFYHAAIQAGGKDNGKPGIREIYHPNYYGAFVFDPDGHNIEAAFVVFDLRLRRGFEFLDREAALVIL